MKLMCFSIKHRYTVIFYLKKTPFILLNKLSDNQKKMILIGLNLHATELILLTPVPAYKMEFFVHTCITTHNAPCVHPRLDSILEVHQTFPIASFGAA